MMGSTEELLFMPLPAWYRGVFSRMDIMELRDRTEARQAQAFYALKDAGKSLLSKPVQRIERFMVLSPRE